jgi:ATP-dependent DNA helicase RecG
MRAFLEGETRLLVATTVIEVGIDVPDADFMVIEHADRFGLSQLHQLRGRIGRAGQRSDCVAIANATTDDAKQRLAAFESLDDGFAISEEDLKIRGPGDLLGTQQHGFFTRLRAVDLMQDLDVMRAARAAARELLAAGTVPPPLAAETERRFGELIRFLRV